VAHCYHRACGQTFSGLTTFDAHIRLLKAEPWLECRNPATLRTPLTDVDGVWRLPTTADGERRIQATRSTR
jgi:hypothetical protein